MVNLTNFTSKTFCLKNKGLARIRQDLFFDCEGCTSKVLQSFGRRQKYSHLSFVGSLSSTWGDNYAQIHLVTNFTSKIELTIH